jgi:hypothetical protein
VSLRILLGHKIRLEKCFDGLVNGIGLNDLVSSCTHVFMGARVTRLEMLYDIGAAVGVVCQCIDHGIADPYLTRKAITLILSGTLHTSHKRSSLENCITPRHSGRTHSQWI